MGINHKNRFGTIAVEKGFLTKEQLLEALNIQAKENIESDTHRLIGQILLDRGYMTEDQIDSVLESINLAMVFRMSAGR